VKKNIVPVVAAGNENDDACNYAFGDLGEFPYEYAIVVGSTWVNGGTDQRSSFSNYGPCVTIYAPGGAGDDGGYLDSIASAGIDSNTDVAYMSGTSMASPLVAGVIANYLSSNPNKTFAQVHDWLLAKARNNKIAGLPSGSVNKLVSIFSLSEPQATLTITNAATTGTARTPITLTTTGGSGTGAVSFATTGSGCSISGAVLNATAAATCVVTATKAASAGFIATTSAPKSFIFLGAQVPLVISNTNTQGVVGTPITLTTTGGSGTGAVSFAATGTGCSISETALSATAAATCVVTATKESQGVFGEAKSVAKNFTFKKLPQTTFFNAPISLGSDRLPYGLTTDSSVSGFAPVITSSTNSVCTVSGAHGFYTLYFVSAGLCKLSADHPGDALYEAAPTVNRTIILTKVVVLRTFTRTQTGSAYCTDGNPASTFVSGRVIIPSPDWRGLSTSVYSARFVRFASGGYSSDGIAERWVRDSFFDSWYLLTRGGWTASVEVTCSFYG
jgi:subtilisin family serine protease